MVKIEKVIGGVIGRFFRRRKWTGFTMPLLFGRVLLLYWAKDLAEEVKLHDAILGVAYTANLLERSYVAHERTHFSQLKAYGFFGFVARYLWGLRKGYRLNPMEVQAYNVQAWVVKGGLPS